MAFAEVSYDSKIKIENLEPQFKKFFYQGIQNAMFYAENKSKESIGTIGKPGVITGHLRRSIQGKGIKEKGILSSDVIYSAIHEFGGVILPVRAKALKFKIGNQWKTVKKVVMPKRPFLRPALEDNIDTLEKIITKAVMEGIG